MLSTLRIQNLAVVETLEIEFQRGLNVLTGETGAGKSIVLKAIDLLCGRRAAADLVRTGADRCVVEGLFDLSLRAREHIAEEAPELASELEGDELLIRRTVDPSGKSKFMLNGQLATNNLVQRLSPMLIDITGQHQQQTLLDPSSHIGLVDASGVPPELREAVSKAYHQFTATRKSLDSFLHDETARREHLEQIAAERTELQEAGIRAGYRQELEAEMTRLASVEHLSAVLNRCMDCLDDGEQNASQLLRSLTSALSDGLRYDSSFKEPLELAETAAVQLGEAKIWLDEYGARLEADPARLEELRSVISEIARLERKYGKREADLAEYLLQISSELALVENGELSERQLRQKAEQAEAALRRAEKELTVARTAAAAKLERSIAAGLKELGMKRAQLTVPVAPAPSSARGADDVRLLFTANPGEPPRPIDRIASGGELSRILLIVKTVLNEQTGASTQIFDEVDTGVSGAVAQIVGARLAAVARHAQVILVTHSPQVAAFADAHFVISKTSKKDRAVTSVSRLGTDGRVEHLAQMLGGKAVESKGGSAKSADENATPSHFHHSAAELLRAAEVLRSGER